MKTTTSWQTMVLAGWLAAVPAVAQYEVAPPAPGIASYWSPEQLEQMTASIALYPDPIVAQLLPAATRPADVVLADRYVQTGGDPYWIDSQPWDPSVRAMAHYPSILHWMDDNLPWTTQMGQAFVNQQADVMSAIQRLRWRAYNLGNLVSTPQQTVVVFNGMIEILPAQPETVYIPYYDPVAVYYRPVIVDRPFIVFGLGFRVGFWLHHDCDWHDHTIIVWHPDHPRPHDWWVRRPEERWHFGREEHRFAEPGRPGEHRAVEQEAPHFGGAEHVGVWHPHETATAPAHAAGRGYEARPAPSAAPSRPESHAPESRRPEPGAQPNTPVHTPPTGPGVRNDPAPGAGHPQPHSAPPTRPAPAPEPRPVQQPPPQHAANPSGALVGVHSAEQTREYSNRGQQSRQGPTPARSQNPHH
jgi:Protein of unknown function (DUF3300)